MGEGRTSSGKNRIFGALLILILREKTVIQILFECHRREYANIEERRNGLSHKIEQDHSSYLYQLNYNHT